MRRRGAGYPSGSSVVGTDSGRASSIGGNAGSRSVAKQGAGQRPGVNGTPASFALVSDEAGASDVGIELVLGDGRKLRIRQGVDEETLRSVLAALEPPRC